MSKVIQFPLQRPVSAQAPMQAPTQPGKVIQRNPLTQAERDRELRANAAAYFAEELARSQARLGRMLLDGETNRRKVQAAEEEVAYYRAELAKVAPEEREERKA